MQTILIFVPCYLPGYKFGGPVRSIANMIEALSDEFDFRVFTLDRDLGDEEPYPGVTPDRWNERENCRVFYCSPENLTASTILEVTRRTGPDTLYFNGLMNARFTIYPLLLRKLGLLDVPRVLLAPRGQLSSEALALKAWKKRSYLTLARLFGLFRDVEWHATSPEEEREIRGQIPGDPPVVRAPNFRVRGPEEPFRGRPKKPGRLDAVFLSRIDPKKNLHYALELLGGLQGDVTFDVYGPVDDAAYRDRCRAIAENLASNVQVKFAGPVAPDAVLKVLSRYHLFFFPTRNENHGHVIDEALRAGCPVLISDRTPFGDLEDRGAGWVVDLDAAGSFRDRLRRMLALDDEDFAGLRERVQAAFRERSDREETRRATLRMLKGSPGGRGPCDSG